MSGIGFGDIFSPVAKVTSIRLLLSVAAAFDFEVEQMDVKETFLHRDLEEEIYMKQPEGFVVKGKKELVCKLKKSSFVAQTIITGATQIHENRLHCCPMLLSRF